MSFWNRGWFGVLLPLATCLQRHLERPIPCRARWIIKMPRADRHRGASRIRNRSDCEIRSQVRDRLYPIRLRAHLLRFGGWTPLAPTPTTEPQEVVGALGYIRVCRAPRSLSSHHRRHPYFRSWHMNRRHPVRGRC